MWDCWHCWGLPLSSLKPLPPTCRMCLGGVLTAISFQPSFALPLTSRTCVFCRGVQDIELGLLADVANLLPEVLVEVMMVRYLNEHSSHQQATSDSFCKGRQHVQGNWVQQMLISDVAIALI